MADINDTVSALSIVDRAGVTRRGLVRGALAVAAALPLGIAGRASADPGPVRLTLPRPTGPYPLGTVELHLVDRSRPDPVAGPGHYRELMAGIWYPARDAARYPRAPWLAAAPTRALLESAGFAADAALAPRTAGRLGAPVQRGRWPVVVFSHGAHDQRADTTIIVQELASHGYVVVTVDHTYDAFSEFPDGRLTVPREDVVMAPPDFARDIRSVLDKIEGFARGDGADLRGALDLDRIGVFGWSKGGTATALVTIEDRRVKAGLSLDGPMQPEITTDLDRPFMLMSAENSRADAPSVAEFWSHLRGWRLEIRARGALHNSYTDYQWLLPQLDTPVGDLDPARAVRIQQAYPRAFFDLHLRRRGHLLDGPSAAFPEVAFLP
jgi:dienelactone hydrolase